MFWYYSALMIAAESSFSFSIDILDISIRILNYSVIIIS